MRRLPLFELEDQPWCPAAVRDGGTDWLAFLGNATRAFVPVVPKIAAAMEATGTDAVLDLCSGAGGPWLSVAPALQEARPGARVELSDRFPNLPALAHVRARSQGRVGFRPEPIDATDVPASLGGVRTMFNCFHHFPPEAARAVLADAVEKRRAIAIFEGCDHRALGVLGVAAQLPLIMALTPFVRPFKLSRVLLTYALPLIPALVLFDGTASMLRLYMRDELRALVASVDGHASFLWDVGTTRIARSPVGITHLVGTPR